MELHWCLESLCELGLIEADGVEDSRLPTFLRECLSHDYLFDGREQEAPRIRASSRWRKTEAALQNDFTRRLNRCKPTDVASKAFELTIKPWFGSPRLIDKMTVFVAHPFREPFETIYRDCIAISVTELGMTSGRASDLFSPTPIISDIWSLIYSSSIVVAECTGKNPNVFYEMGIAHTLGRPVVLISQTKEDVPFDIRHIRYIEYQNSDEGLAKLRFTLAQAIRESTEVVYTPNEDYAF